MAAAPAAEEAPGEEAKPERGKGSSSRRSRSSEDAPRGRTAKVPEPENVEEVAAAPVPERHTPEEDETRAAERSARSRGGRGRRDEESRLEPAPAAKAATRTLEPADEDGWNGPLPSFLSVSLGG
jgi:hypothetical protein